MFFPVSACSPKSTVPAWRFSVSRKSWVGENLRAPSKFLGTDNPSFALLAGLSGDRQRDSTPGALGEDVRRHPKEL